MNIIIIWLARDEKTPGVPCKIRMSLFPIVHCYLNKRSKFMLWELVSWQQTGYLITCGEYNLIISHPGIICDVGWYGYLNVQCHVVVVMTVLYIPDVTTARQYAKIQKKANGTRAKARSPDWTGVGQLTSISKGSPPSIPYLHQNHCPWLQEFPGNQQEICLEFLVFPWNSHEILRTAPCTIVGYPHSCDVPWKLLFSHWNVS